jgi:hypothetical protein
MLEVLKHDGLLLALAEFTEDCSPSEAHPMNIRFIAIIETIFKAFFLITLLRI